MQRLIIPAAGIKHGDIILTADPREPSCVYADVVVYTYGDYGWTYAATDTDRFRFAEDQNVTVLRGVKL